MNTGSHQNNVLHGNGDLKAYETSTYTFDGTDATVSRSGLVRDYVGLGSGTFTST
jgi:hypothetical protein